MTEHAIKSGNFLFMLFVVTLSTLPLFGCLGGSSGSSGSTVPAPLSSGSTAPVPSGTGTTATTGTSTTGNVFNAHFITGGTTGFANPGFVAIDGNQNVWITNMGLFASPGVTELTQRSGYNAASAINIIDNNPYYYFFNVRDIAIDKSNNIWIVTNESQLLTTALETNLIELTSASNYALSGALVIPLTGFGKANGITIDGSGNVWVSIFDGLGLMGGIVEFPYSVISNPSATGPSIAASANFFGTPNNLPDPTGSIHGPVKMAADHAGNIWIANYYGDSVTELPVSAITASGATGASIQAASVTIVGGNTGFNSPTGIAVDQEGNVWIANIGNNSVTELPATAISAAGATATTIATAAINISGGTTSFSGPTGIAVDGAGNIWIVNNNYAGSITELTKTSAYSAASAINFPAGAADVNNTPTGIAVDGTGNVWVTNSTIILGPGGGYEFVTYTSDGVTEFPGIAAPVTTLPMLPGVAGK